jgi:predicted ATPase
MVDEVKPKVEDGELLAVRSRKAQGRKNLLKRCRCPSKASQSSRKFFHSIAMTLNARTKIGWRVGLRRVQAAGKFEIRGVQNPKAWRFHI